MNSGCHLGFGSSKFLSCPLETDSGCYLEFGSKFDLSSWEEKKNSMENSMGAYILRAWWGKNSRCCCWGQEQKTKKHKNCNVRSYWPVDCFFLLLLMATNVDVQASRKRLQERIKTKKRSEKSFSGEEKKRSAHSRTHLQIRGLEATRLINYSATANSALNWDVASTKWSSSLRADSLHHQFHCPRRCSREAYNTTSPSLDSGHRTGRRLWSLDPQPL